MRSYSIALPPTCQFCHSSLSLTSSFHPTHICYVWFARPKRVRGETQAANVLKGYPCLLTQLACCFATFSVPRLKLLLSTHFEGYFTFVRSCKHSGFKFFKLLCMGYGCFYRCDEFVLLDTTDEKWRNLSSWKFHFMIHRRSYFRAYDMWLT